MAMLLVLESSSVSGVRRNPVLFLSAPLWPSSHHVWGALCLHSEPHSKGQKRPSLLTRSHLIYGQWTAICWASVNVISNSSAFNKTGPSGVSPGSLSDQRERLSDVRRHATCCPVCGSSHQRQNRLRTNDFCRQGECCCSSCSKNSKLCWNSPGAKIQLTVCVVDSVTHVQTSAGNFPVGFRSTSVTAVWIWP